MLLKLRRINYRNFSHSHTKAVSKKKSYSNTVLLPQTKLPLYLNGNKLHERDETISSLPAFTGLYDWQRKNLKGPEFILHDGPPYANGTPHMGHAMNKILKDTIIRSKVIQGKRVHFVPGWDCHGLPIELKAVSSSNASNLLPIQIRQRARNFARQAIDKQKHTFKSWAVTGDWENCYLTFNNSYIKNEINTFYKLYQNKLVFRDVKPVYWSPSSRTALAEAELEYNECHKSPAIFLKVKLHYVPDCIACDKNRVFGLIWTTTPWTLPSNQAICFNPSLSYSIIQPTGRSELFLIATNLIGDISKILNCNCNIINTFEGNLLKDVTYYHPFNSHEVLSFVAGDHVKDSKGTGLVHTAPAHGPDDYLIALKNNMPIVSLIDEMGCYTPEAGPKLEGLFALSDGNKCVLDMIHENVLYREDYIHSYPYDWRTKQPVIIRASKQWFIDTESLKEKAIELLGNVTVIPKVHSEAYKNNLISQLKKRPYWCISRQRSWGVPIPVFYDSRTDETIINKETINHLCNVIDESGADCWWSLSTNVLLPKELSSNTDSIIKGKDIFDIWFDSGLSWSNMFSTEQIADMYLEGIDQFTGWFQSSLLTSVALRDKAPYKSIYVHGFAVDDQGLKMSKSLGNVIDPCDVIMGKKGFKAFGIDCLRWWVVCHANSDSVTHISTNVLEASANEVQKIRSVLRFAIGALFDYREKTVDHSSLQIIDKYLLYLLETFYKQMLHALNNYEFNKLSPAVINFVTNPVSSLYYSVIKDRLYCNEANSSDRRAAQYVLFQIFKVVVQMVAPILPHLAEELYLHLPQKQEGSIFQWDKFRMENEWPDSAVVRLAESFILNVKRDFHKIAGANTSDVHVIITASECLMNDFKNIGYDHRRLSDELVYILQSSQVTVVEDKLLDGYLIEVTKTDLLLCDRCRRMFSEQSNQLCNRCNSVVNVQETKEYLLHKQ